MNEAEHIAAAPAPAAVRACVLEGSRVRRGKP
jgi:hypothetical protein